MITIDGRMGEGGGQILRTCLSLSLISGLPFRIRKIRSGRSSPGLAAQHLNAVLLAQEIGHAQVEGAKLGSTDLTFAPRNILGGVFHRDIGTAGSTSLVIQALYLPLSYAKRGSRISLTGGTHVPYAPTYDWLNFQWLKYSKLIGFDIALDFKLAGFYPRGGGQVIAEIKPASNIRGINISDRGSLNQIRGVSVVANLDRKIAERQRQQVIRRLGSKFPLNDIRIKQLPSKNKGSSITLICEFENSQCCYSSLGAPGKPSEVVADEVCDLVETCISSQAAIDEYLGDQLLLPLSLAGTGSTYSTVKITEHILTNADVIKTFINPTISITGNTGSQGSITIIPENQ
jgi:RNA 3'-terminal phosphate cyclase (ATP)